MTLEDAQKLVYLAQEEYQKLHDQCYGPTQSQTGPRCISSLHACASALEELESQIEEMKGMILKKQTAVDRIQKSARSLGLGI